ncbi:MAG TPA: DUF4262 domain-containing protein [Actinomycetota bacterium]
MDTFSWEDELFAKISHQIDRFGWSVVYVGGGGCSVPGCAGDHESDLVGVGLPPYGYTVGLPLHFDHAELVLVGLDRDATLRILNLIGSAIANGARLAPGDPLDVDGMSLKVGRCAVSRVRNGLVAVSMDYHDAIKHPSVPNPLQIIWSDADGRSPGDPRFDRQAQPLLARPAARDRAASRQRPRTC